MMECVTCKSSRIEKFVDGFGEKRVFCRNCWVSFPEPSPKIIDPRSKIYVNFGAVREVVSY